jgi:hypothetical protein
MHGPIWPPSCPFGPLVAPSLTILLRIFPLAVPTTLGAFLLGAALPPSRSRWCLVTLFLSRCPLGFLAFRSHRSTVLERSVFNTSLLLFQFFLWPLRLFIQHCESLLVVVVWHPSPPLSWFIVGSVLVLKDPLYQVLFCDETLLLVPFLDVLRRRSQVSPCAPRDVRC